VGKISLELCSDLLGDNFVQFSLIGKGMSIIGSGGRAACSSRAIASVVLGGFTLLWNIRFVVFCG